ncbi:MAG TPA: RES domain-containing protein [Vicinamibacterales bacterium]|nr:RES domain-containing protein [Vicinamibacterales bacterium]
MTWYRAFAWNRSARADSPDGPLWFPRPFQGEGRHDNPAAYGCLYLADRPVSCVVEQLAPFRGQRLSAALLRRRSLPLALAALDLDEDAVLLDLDDPAVLRRERLRPSRVATRQRDVTQPQALDLYRRHSDAAGLRWWSTWESLWINLTLFDRAAKRLRLSDVRELTLDDPVVIEAADVFGLRVV